MTPPVTVGDIVRATRRAAVTLAEDPVTRHYSPETVALVLKRTVSNMAGAGDMAVMAARMANDPELADVPDAVVEILMVASYKHFAKALAK